MEVIGESLAKKRFVLRSGGADGADKAFENGCNRGLGKKEIYLPWKGFNWNPSALFEPPPSAFKIAQELAHPYWNKISQPSKKLLARNVCQVLGETLDTPSAFVVCYTPDGCISYNTRAENSGGTWYAIALAAYLDIPVYNLFYEDHIDKVSEICQTTIKKDWPGWPRISGAKSPKLST